MLAKSYGHQRPERVIDLLNGFKTPAGVRVHVSLEAEILDDFVRVKRQSDAPVFARDVAQRVV
jgi:hypothetical protein